MRPTTKFAAAASSLAVLLSWSRPPPNPCADVVCITGNHCDSRGFCVRNGGGAGGSTGAGGGTATGGGAGGSAGGSAGGTAGGAAGGSAAGGAGGAGGGAPGVCTANALVISAAYGGGGNMNATFTNDFVELHNRSSATVYLGGLTLQYGSAMGSTWSVTALPDAGVPAGGWYLVQFASGGAVGAALPAADSTGTTNLASTAAKLALVNGAALTTACPFDAGVTTVLDYVGIGTTNCVEGAPAAAGSNTTAVVRAQTGCLDTEVNGSDFTTDAVAAPKSSASVASSCSCP